EARRTGRVHAAHGAARASGERLERVGRTALDAARQVRQVPGEPEQLQLEAEDERIDGRSCRRGGRLVEQVEEACERAEGPLVRLRLAEEPQHRLGADQADVEAVRLLAAQAVRAQQLDAGDRLQ